MTQTLIDYLQLIRAPAMFTAFSNILAAHIIVTRGDIQLPALLLLMASSAALYSGGMALNDWFDFAVDSRQRPGRPLPSGRISRHHALLFAGLLLGCGLALAALVTSLSFYIALAIVLLVLLYDGLLKGTGAGGMVMGGCRYFNWLLGFSILPLSGMALAIPVPVFLYILSLTLLSREEDSAENKHIALFCALGILLAGLAMFGLALVATNGAGAESMLVLIGTAYLCYRIWLTYNDFSSRRIQATMQLLILAIIPLDALLVILFGPPWLGLLVLTLLLPGKLLARVMYVT